ncbi:class I SAM-dependent methyltransferase [Sulfolobus sp. S-194]|uniref:class I SAM-dependent methyltransferase n=1 Tax=Sulfolobus sp. S-194 TaxID=2512240 RepID=UPI001437008F|nr:class I SAM-dependent methyltransferase [Sulfolobus sp. S-194]QIW24651.1 class I SAM-dependent methyltransferase [Sulfolobus sp. S-194]
MSEKEKVKNAYELIVHRRKPLPYLSLIKGKIVGDIGCGSGQNCLALKSRFVICLDIALRQLIEAKRRGCDNLVQADMEYLPFRDNTFDSLLYIASLHHLKDPSLALKECYRCLKSKGEVLVTVWLVQPRFFFRRNIFLKSRINNLAVERYYHLYFPWELRRVMAKQGFFPVKTFLYRVDSLLPNNELFYGIKRVLV